MIDGFCRYLFALSLDAAVYELTSKEGYLRFVWKYHRDNNPHGPFITTTDATKHFESYEVSIRESMKNTIRVDFKARKRIP